MSSSIAIPRRKKRMTSVAASGSSGSISSSGESSGWTFGSFGSVKEVDVAASPPTRGTGARRPSLMSASLTRTEHTVINVGDSETPRLITCVKASQGFDWNQEIFLPSYANYDFDDLERKQDPVQEILVTDEEVASMFLHS